MSLGRSMVTVSLDHPKAVIAGMILLTLALSAFIPMVKVDTDPENMLAEDEAVRVFHNAMKEEFALHDMVVLGVVNETDPDGVFNPASLARVYELTEFARAIAWEAKGETVRPVVEVDLMAPSTVDDIRPGDGAVTLERLMKKPPATREAAQAIRARAKENPLLDGTLVSEDGRAVCIYIPLTDKRHSYRVYQALREKIATLEGPERYHIAGLPVAEDVFGVQMFIQMAISAPAAMLVIFLLMYAFFRSSVVVAAALIDAMVSVLGRPDRVTPHVRRTRPDEDDLADNMLAVFEYPIATATVRSAVVEVDGGRRRQFVVCGDQGTVDIRPLEPPKLLLALAEARDSFKRGYQEVELPAMPGRYDDQLIDLARIVRGEKETDYPPSHDLAVHEAILLASALPLD